MDDAGDSLTSVSISPNLEMLAASTENSSVLLYKLHENDYRKPTLASRHQQRKCRLSASSARKAKLNSSHFINNNLNSSAEKTATGGGEDESRGREQQRPGARLSKLFAECLGGGGGGVSTDSNYVQELLGGHAGVVLKAKFTHDSKYLLSCGDDGQASLWSVSRALRDLQPAAGSAGESFEGADSATTPSTDTTGAGAGETTSSEFDFDSFESRIRAGRDEDEDEEASFSTAAHVCTYSGHLYPVWDLSLIHI